MSRNSILFAKGVKLGKFNEFEVCSRAQRVEFSELNTNSICLFLGSSNVEMNIFRLWIPS